MLSDHQAIATIAVKNLPTAARFYEDVLGLRAVSKEGDDLIVYQCGNSMLNVYRSAHAGSNQATSVAWAVGEGIDAEVRALKEKGVTFEHYEMAGMKLVGDVHEGGDMKVAWFKDPDGNILNLVGR